MTSPIHPEELFDLERQATLSESERAVRDAHLASCASCRMEHGLRHDFAREPLEGEADRALVTRAVSGAIAALAAAPPSAARRRFLASACAGVLVAGLAAAAARGSRPAPSAARSSAARPVPALPLTPARLEVVPPAAPPPSAAPTPPLRRVTVESAAQLFARANATRRSGALTEALALYRRLLSEFGGTREAQTGAVTAARLLLETGGSAAEALALFERYARSSPSGNLAEEALLGRAEALERLGRTRDEAAAWNDLLQRFPATAQRSRAEARLNEIGASPP